MQLHYTEEDGDVQKGGGAKIEFRLAPAFKAKFVAPLPRSGGAIEYEVLKTWLLRQLMREDSE